MMSRVFFDTNILIYGADASTPAKQSVSLTLLEHAGVKKCGCISTQVLQEFFVIATKKLGVEPLAAKKLIYSFSNWHIATIALDDIQRAIDGHVLWQLSFWDALIITAASKLKCDVLYTEDLNHGQVINGIRIVNPYIEA